MPPELRGAAFGLRQSMDTVGAFAGPLIAIALMLLLSGNVRLIFLLAMLPALLSVAVLIAFVREPASAAAPKARPRLNRESLARIGRGAWIAVAIGSVMSMARFSDAFLILRAGEAGLPMTYAPLVLVVMNLVYSGSAWPLGALSDRTGKRGLLMAGFAVLALADLVLAFGQGPGMVLLGVALWGLHMGLTQGLLAAMVADAAPPDLRGTAFGLFNLATGLALLLGNGLAGLIWSGAGSAATFGAGAVLAAVSLLAMAVAHPFRA